MSTFRLEIKMGNAAFEDDAFAELARILRATADRVEQGQPSGVLLDVNGGRVGKFGTSRGTR